MSIKIENEVGYFINKYDKAFEAFAGIKDKDDINNIRMIAKLSENDILNIHDYLCKQYGGDSQVRDYGLFSSICNQPYQEMYGQVLYPTAYEKAAKYLESFAKYQVFIDGNKRTAFATMLIFLEHNNIEFNMSQRDSYDFVMDVVKGKYDDIESISNVIKSNSKNIIRESLGDFKECDDFSDDEIDF